MENILPDTFLNFVASIMLVSSILCLLVTFIEAKKSHATRMFSILMVASLALFSSYWVTYFAAIFIIATAVTELEFLQNLAAILRKDKNYFDYKTEALTKEENKRRVHIEAAEDEAVILEASDETTETDAETETDVIRLASLQGLTRSQSMKLFYEVEEKTIEYLKGLYPAIEGGVRIKNNGMSVELDGMVSGNRSSDSKIFEVKWIRSRKNTHSLLWHAAKQARQVLSKYKDITGRDAELYLILVVNTEDSIGEGSIDNIKEKLDMDGIRVKTIRLSELGYTIQE